MTLSEFFSKNPRVALGFSGGVDSAYLLYAAISCGADIKPYYIKTCFQPQFELDDAIKLTDQLSIPLTVIEHNVLSSPAVSTNAADRCYHCKLALFSLLKEQASQDGYNTIIDGTNFDDEYNDRPGMRAIRELGVKSPLRECGLTKKQIRTLSKTAGLFTYAKPAYACLATRIPTGREITPELLSRVEQAENAMRTFGFSDFRVQVWDEGAKIQVKTEQLSLVLQRRSDILEFVGQYFSPVTLDLETR